MNGLLWLLIGFLLGIFLTWDKMKEIRQFIFDKMKPIPKSKQEEKPKKEESKTAAEKYYD